MYIIRVATGRGEQIKIRTFTFEDKVDLERGVSCLKKTTCKGFSANVREPGAKRGQLLERWDGSNRCNCDLFHSVKSGAYEDRVYEVFGPKDECIEAAQRTNAEANCWASRRADLSHVAGDLYCVTYTEPYAD